MTRSLHLALRAQALRLIAEAGTSHAVLATRIGVAESTLSGWLGARSNPTIASWSRIFYALNAEIEVRAVARKARDAV